MTKFKQLFEAKETLDDFVNNQDNVFDGRRGPTLKVGSSSEMFSILNRVIDMIEKGSIKVTNDDDITFKNKNSEDVYGGDDLLRRAKDKNYY